MFNRKSRTTRNHAREGANPNAISLTTRWTLNASEAEIVELLDIEQLSKWWGETFFDLDVLHRPPSGLQGARGIVRSKGLLPYRFKWDAEVLTEKDGLCVIQAVGDFDGTATFRRPLPDEPPGFYFDWDVLIQEPFLRRLCPLIRPLCHWNHAYALALGATRIEREILRRRSASDLGAAQ